MLGKPLVCIVIGPFVQGPDAALLGRHPLLQPFLHRFPLWFLLNQYRQQGLDTAFLLLHPNFATEIDLLRSLLLELSMKVEMIPCLPDQNWADSLREQLQDEDQVICHHSPWLDLCPIQTLLDFHKSQQADCSLRLSRQPLPGAQTVALLADGSVLESSLAQRESHFATGCAILEADIFEALLENPSQMLHLNLLPELLRLCEYRSGLVQDELVLAWVDLDSYLKAQQTCLTPEFLTRSGLRKMELKEATVWCGKDVYLADRVSFEGQVLLGDRVLVRAGSKITGPAVLADDCRLGEDCQLKESFLWPEVHLEQDSQVEHSWLGRRVHIAAGSQLKRLWVGDRSQVCLQDRLPEGSALGPGTRLRLKSKGPLQ